MIRLGAIPRRSVPGSVGDAGRSAAAVGPDGAVDAGRGAAGAWRRRRLRATGAGGCASRRASAAAAWPDDEARAFGAAFARAYFTVSSREPGAQARALARFVAPELFDSIAPVAGERSRGSSVAAVLFARAAVVDRRHALLTFAVTVGDGTRYLTVPIARDDRGGLVVDELPSFAAPPRVASLAVAPAESVTGAERDELAAIVERFLRAYVAGDAGALAYLVPAGVRIATPGPRGYAFVGLAALAQAAPPAGRVRRARGDRARA